MVENVELMVARARAIKPKILFCFHLLDSTIS